MDVKQLDPKTVEAAVLAARRVCFIEATYGNALVALADALAAINVYPSSTDDLRQLAYKAAAFPHLALGGNGAGPAHRGGDNERSL